MLKQQEERITKKCSNNTRPKRPSRQRISEWGCFMDIRNVDDENM